MTSLAASFLSLPIISGSTVSNASKQWLRFALSRSPKLPEQVPAEIVAHPGSNEVFEARYGSDVGSSWILKRASHDWQAASFHTAVAASARLRSRGLLVPDIHVLVDENEMSLPVQIYPRVPHPTLRQCWDSLSQDERLRALLSAGGLMRQVHQIHIPSFGPLRKRAEADESFDSPSLQMLLGKDIGERLLNSVRGVWGEGVEMVETLHAAIPALIERLGGREAVLVHGDLHMDNLLYKFASIEDGEEQAGFCAGFIDLDSARGGAAEEDMAAFQVLHGPSLALPLSEVEMSAFQAGYGAELDDFALAFYRTLHRANLGFYAAWKGSQEMAAALLDTADSDLRTLRS